MTQTFWQDHLTQLADHERALGRNMEHRAQLLAGVGGALVAAGLSAPYSAGGWWESLNFAAQFSFGLAVCALAVATSVFWLALTPMDGRQFPAGSPAALADGCARWWSGESSDEATLSERFKEGRDPQVLVKYLESRLGADLSAWLTDADAEIHTRLVFWYWAHRQARLAKGRLVGFALSLMGLGLALAFSAAVVQALGWWLLPLLVGAILLATQIRRP